MKELDEFLLARAMEHDSPTLLFRLGCEYLISARVIRPSPDTVIRRVVHAREQAQRETYDRLAHELTPQRCAELDGLLVTDSSIRMSRLRWLSTGPVEASAAAVKNEVEKLGFVRSLSADTLDLSVLPAERRRFLATLGRRLTGQALERRDPQRRYPILLTVLAQAAADVLDEVMALFDQALSGKFSAAENRMRDQPGGVIWWTSCCSSGNSRSQNHHRARQTARPPARSRTADRGTSARAALGRWLQQARPRNDPAAGTSCPRRGIETPRRMREPSPGRHSRHRKMCPTDTTVGQLTSQWGDGSRLPRTSPPMSWHVAESIVEQNGETKVEVA